MNGTIEILKSFRLSNIAKGKSDSRIAKEKGDTKFNVINKNFAKNFEMYVTGGVNCPGPKSCCIFDDLSMYDMSKVTRDVFLKASFTKATKFPEEFTKRVKPDKIYELGKIYGFGIEEVHSQGILGQGINIALLENKSAIYHKGFRDRVINRTREYVDYSSSDVYTSISCLADKYYGVVPKANIYLYDIYSDYENSFDNKVENKLIEIYEYNKNISVDCARIHIIVISAFINHYRLKEIEEKLASQGCFIIDESLIGYNQNLKVSKPIYDDELTCIKEHIYDNKYICYNKDTDLLLPSAGKIVALPIGSTYAYEGEEAGYRTTMYLAGMYALVRQVDKTITFDKFITLAMSTADVNSLGQKCINVSNIIDLLKK